MNNTINNISYGFSMYGGYYIQYTENNKIQYARFEKLKDLKSYCKDKNINLKNVYRFDN